MSSSCTLSVVSARTAPHLHGARCDHVDSVTADHVLVGHVSACRWPLVLLAKAERPSVERHTSLCDAAVRVSFRSLLVQRDQWDTYRGPKKVISCFAVRRGRGHRAAAPVESCQSLPKRSPWGRLGSALYTCNRLHRLRRRFKHFWPISLSSPRCLGIFRAGLASRALREHWAAASMACAVQALTQYHTYPRGSSGADLYPKKVSNLDPMAPRSRQKRQLPEGLQ